MANLVNRKMEYDTIRRNRIVVSVLSIVCLCLFTYLFTQWQQHGTLLPVWGAAVQSDEETDGVYYTLYDMASGEEIE